MPHPRTRLAATPMIKKRMMGIIKDKLLEEIKAFCELNSLDTEEFINKTLRDAFVVAKYGERPTIDLKFKEPEEEPKVEEEKVEEVVKELPPEPVKKVRVPFIDRIKNGNQDIYGE